MLFTDLPPATDPDTLDGLMAASHDGPFAVDLRRLSPADAAAVGAVTRQRFGAFDVPQRPLAAYDVVVHLPHVTPAQPDPDTLAYAPAEVRDAFARS